MTNMNDSMLLDTPSDPDGVGCASGRQAGAHEAVSRSGIPHAPPPRPTRGEVIAGLGAFDSPEVS